jgi:crotonobetainyl-CoA:carnitine CoA-transferase CaiB-like acyl-CoA transferase
MTAAARQALAGVRVLEIGGGVAGPYGARLLGDLGADVVKIEPPGAGDPVRAVPPFADPVAGVRRSILFEYLNWGKRSVELDLSDAGRRAELGDLVRWADIVVVSLSPAATAESGLTAEVLLGWNPRAVLTFVSSFGHSGPYRDWAATDLVLQAMGGVMHISGTAERPPIKPGLSQSFYCAGINAAYVSLAGYLAARRTGAGVTLDLSVHEAMASQLVMNEPYYAFAGAIQGRRSSTQDPFSGEPIPTADGYLSLQSTTLTPVARFAELFGDDRFAAEKYGTEAARGEHAVELAELLAEHLANAASRDVFEAAGALGLLAGFVQSAAQLLTCPQLQARSAWRVDPGLTVDGTPVRLPARFAELSATPISAATPAPDLGADNSFAPPPFETRALEARAFETLALETRAFETGAFETPPRPVDPPGVPAGDPGAGERPGPLSGMLVLDLSTVFAVPYIGGLLSDLGAEVVKVEAPARLDQTRSSFGASFDNQPAGDYWNKASTFQVLNRGKRSVVLDLSVPDGRAALLTLVSQADVLLDNFTPQVMRKWGMTYDALAKVNPRLIMLSNTGYGSTGPWASFKAQGTTLEATMGLTSVTGYPDGGPAKAGQSYPDFLACWTGLLTILAAVVSRDATGRGQWIDLGMYQLGATVIPEALIGWQASGREQPRLGDRDPDAVLSGLFTTAEHGRLVAVSVASLDQLRALDGPVPGIADAIAGLGGADCESASALRGLLANWIAARGVAETCAVLQSLGVAAGPVMDARDLLLDPHLIARGFYQWLDFGDPLGFRPLIGRPFTWDSSGSEVAIAGRAPRFGEHNEYVLTKLAGFDRETYELLQAARVVSDTPVDPPAGRPVPIEDMARRGELRVDSEYQRTLAAVAPPRDDELSVTTSSEGMR